MGVRVRRQLSFIMSMDGGSLVGGGSNASAPATQSVKFGPRLTVKKKVALVLGFVGQEYSGFQKNHGVRTIEGELQNALHRAGLISDENKEMLQKISWSKAARTDKGVSGVGQVASLKVALPRGEEPGSITVTMDKVEKDLNAQLPPEIRVFGVLRTTAGFGAKVSCNQRRYEYLMPLEVLRQCGTPGDTIAAFSFILTQYQGTHSFHNFTAVGRIGKADLRRYIRKFTCEAADLSDSDRPYVRLVVFGNSFLLYQIRKMVALAILTHNEDVPKNSIPLALMRGVRLNVAPVPGHGLLLAACDFSGYIKGHGAGPDGPVSIHPDEQPRLSALCEEFKTSMVYPSIISIEEASAADGERIAMIEWLKTIRSKHLPAFLTELEVASVTSTLQSPTT